MSAEADDKVTEPSIVYREIVFEAATEALDRGVDPEDIPDLTGEALSKAVEEHRDGE